MRVGERQRLGRTLRLARIHITVGGVDFCQVTDPKKLQSTQQWSVPNAEIELSDWIVKNWLSLVGLGLVGWFKCDTMFTPSPHNTWISSSNQMKFVKHIRFTSIGDFENAKAMFINIFFLCLLFSILKTNTLTSNSKHKTLLKI